MYTDSLEICSGFSLFLYNSTCSKKINVEKPAISFVMHVCWNTRYIFSLIFFICHHLILCLCRTINMRRHVFAMSLFNGIGFIMSIIVSLAWLQFDAIHARRIGFRTSICLQIPCRAVLFGALKMPLCVTSTSGDYTDLLILLNYYYILKWSKLSTRRLFERIAMAAGLIFNRIQLTSDVIFSFFSEKF